MTHRTSRALALMLASLGACSPAVSPLPGSDAAPPAVDATAADATSADDAAAPPADAPLDDAATQRITTSIGPLHLMPGEETTMCVLQPLGNAVSGFVRQIHASLGPSSHHLIFYRAASSDTAQPTPFACRGFSGITTTAFETPMLIAQQHETTLTMPHGVGMVIGANQLVRLEFHVINTTAAPVDVRGDVAIDFAPDSAPLIPADVMFWGNTNITIPAHGTAMVDFFHQPWSNAHIFALTSHTHQHGTLATISAATGVRDPSTTNEVWQSVTDVMPLHRSTSWSDPPLTLFPTPLQLPTGQGLHLQCNYQNNGTADVTFGEGFNDEMCFMWAYYYPAYRGTQLCAEGYRGATDRSVTCYPP